VSWHETQGGSTTTFVGHFEGNPANPVFHIDTGGLPTTTPVTSDDDITDVRQPVASTCPADPFTQDGASCPGNAVGTPFFALTNTTSGPRALFAHTYQPDNVQTGSASGVGTTTGTVAGSVNPAGAPVHVHFDFGKTTSYGSSTASQFLSPGEVQAAFNAALTGLPANTTIHYRAVATSDFGTFVGADKTFKTASSVGTGSAGKASVKGTTASIRLTCKGASGASCRFTLRMTVTERFRGRRLIAISARKKVRKVIVTVGRASATLRAGQTKVVKVSLNGTGKRLLARFHRLHVTLKVTQSLGRNRTATIRRQIVTFKAPKKGHRH
jgi:hypothetical protein